MYPIRVNLSDQGEAAKRMERAEQPCPPATSSLRLRGGRSRHCPVSEWLPQKYPTIQFSKKPAFNENFRSALNFVKRIAFDIFACASAALSIGMNQCNGERLSSDLIDGIISRNEKPADGRPSCDPCRRGLLRFTVARRWQSRSPHVLQRLLESI
jgi:hypothetical protein